MTRAQPTTSQIVAFQRRLLLWHQRHRRSFPWRAKTTSKYRKIVAELLLQRTRAEMVAKFYPSFVMRFPSWRTLAKADEDTLKTYLQPIGLWRRRARSLIALAKAMVLRRGTFPENRTDIEQLPGVGQYMTNAILLLCHDSREPLIDVNMARVLERHFGPRQLVDIRYDPYLQRLARRAIASPHAVTLNWAILDLAATTCTLKNPGCNVCPLWKTCQYANSYSPLLRHELRSPGT